MKGLMSGVEIRQRAALKGQKGDRNGQECGLPHSIGLAGALLYTDTRYNNKVYYNDKKKKKITRGDNQKLCKNIVFYIPRNLQSTLVISNHKGLSETLPDIRTSKYQSCRSEENNKSNNHI